MCLGRIRKCGRRATQQQCQNSPFHCSRRPERSVLRIDGPEATAFPANLVTADIEGLAAGRGRLCRAADAAGQDPVRFLRRARTATAFLLDCAASQQAELIKRLDVLQAAGQGDDRRSERSARWAFRRQAPPRAYRLCDPRDAAHGLAGDCRRGHAAGRARAMTRPASRWASPTATPISARANSSRMRPISISSAR